MADSIWFLCFYSFNATEYVKFCSLLMKQSIYAQKACPKILCMIIRQPETFHDISIPGVHLTEIQEVLGNQNSAFPKTSVLTNCLMFWLTTLKARFHWFRLLLLFSGINLKFLFYLQRCDDLWVTWWLYGQFRQNRLVILRPLQRTLLPEKSSSNAPGHLMHWKK